MLLSTVFYCALHVYDLCVKGRIKCRCSRSMQICLQLCNEPHLFASLPIDKSYSSDSEQKACIWHYTQPRQICTLVGDATRKRALPLPRTCLRTGWRCQPCPAFASGQRCLHNPCPLQTHRLERLYATKAQRGRSQLSAHNLPAAPRCTSLAVSAGRPGCRPPVAIASVVKAASMTRIHSIHSIHSYRVRVHTCVLYSVGTALVPVVGTCTYSR